MIQIEKLRSLPAEKPKTERCKLNRLQDSPKISFLYDPVTYEPQIMGKPESDSRATATLVEHFRKLDLEVKNWENRRNEQGGFDLELGVAPSTLVDQIR